MTLGLRLSAKNGPQSMFSRITAPRPSNHATMSGSRRGSNASQSSIRHVFGSGGMTHIGGHGGSASASGNAGANHGAGYVSIQGLSQKLGHGNSQRQNPVSSIKETEVDRRLSAVARAKAGPLRAPSARGLNAPSSTTTNITSSLLNSSRYDIHLTYTFLLYLVMYTFLLYCCYVLATCSFHV